MKRPVLFCLLVSVVLTLSVGCGSSGGGSGGGAGGGSGGGSSGGGAGGGSAGGTGGGAGGGSGGGSGGVALTVAECQQEMGRFESANCADKATWTAVKTDICPKSTNTTSALCNDALVKAKACHTQFQTATIACVLGNTDSQDPCAVDVLMGVLCVNAMNNNFCAATTCASFTDCGSGYGCNDKTKRCFNNSNNCIGLPCSSFTDCPTGQTCNSGIKQCVKS
jgi:hypothetical protein